MASTPTEAHDALIGLLAILSNEGQSVLRGSLAREFNTAAVAAEAFSRLPPTASTCRELAVWLALMTKPVFDSPRFKAKPPGYRELLIECTQVVANALSCAAGDGMPPA